MLYEGWLISLWPRVEVNELYTTYFIHLLFSSLNDYAEHLKLITFAIFLFWVTENYVSVVWETDNVSPLAVIHLLCVKSSLKEVQENTKDTLEEGTPSDSMLKRWDAEF